MNQDKFFTQKACDRCFQSLEGKMRTCSWFTDECICEDCKKRETKVRTKLIRNNQHDFEGCGFIPKI